jgi:hypothetical protein
MTRRVGGRGGKGGAEPRLRVRRREQEVVEQSTAGQSQHAIARALGISQSAVCQILRRVDERSARESQDRLARHRAEHERHLGHLAREAMLAWQASKAPRTRRRQRRTGGGEASGGAGVAELIVEDSCGNPQYLEAARRLLADLGRVRGVSRDAAGAGSRGQGDAAAPPLRFTLDLANRQRPDWLPDGRAEIGTVPETSRDGEG